METVSAVVVPMDEGKALESLSIPKSLDADLEVLTKQTQESIASVVDVRHRLLVRSGANGTAGLYAYDVVLEGENDQPGSDGRNVRATRLAMACGLFSFRFFGNVLLVRASMASREDLAKEEVYGACCISPDLRVSIQREMHHENDNNPPTIPSWIGGALQQNYHDKAVLMKLANVMTTGDSEEEEDSGSEDSDNRIHEEEANQDAEPPKEEFRKRESVTNQPLCLHCRRTSLKLCPGCKACYFCDGPRECRTMGWTHECLCPTWKVYADRREELSRFPWLGKWTEELTTPAFHSSEKPYEDYLIEQLQFNTDDIMRSSWWSTELHGWSGGMSSCAKTVDVSVRKSYARGFAPLTEIPPQRRVQEEDTKRSNESVRRNSLGFLCLASWEQYYQLRGIPASSPVALLCTFPLTVYHAISHFGEVPCTVARMLKRPLRVHIVGVEKEANFLDLFQEVGYLLPEDFSVDLTFIVREDMLPPKCRQGNGTEPIINQLQLCSNLSITVVSGTYGASLDPNFDCGSGGSPDMVIGLNAGLYAYETWRSVVHYLYRNPGIVGVFSDYNEYSGENCASLAGHQGRESLCVNPFRQPRAMPVYSMNLPQFSNGFLYVMNAQELD